MLSCLVIVIFTFYFPIFVYIAYIEKNIHILQKFPQKGVKSGTKIPNFIWKVQIVSTSETPTYRNE